MDSIFRDGILHQHAFNRFLIRAGNTHGLPQPRIECAQVVSTPTHQQKLLPDIENTLNRLIPPYECSGVNYPSSLSGDDQITRPQRQHGAVRPCQESLQITKVLEKETKRFACNQCNVTAADQHKLRRHVLRVHQKIKPFQCRVCDMKFCVRHERDRHEFAKHENIGRFDCRECQRSFSRKYIFSKHMREVHGQEVDKPSCEACGATFENNALLIHHKRNALCPSRNI